MFNVKHLLSHALLALALVSGAASAAPVKYHVDLDTSSASGTALVNFTFDALTDAVLATASLSNFTGNYGALFETGGDVTGSVPAGVMISNGGVDNFLSQFVTLGGHFGFDVAFDFGDVNPGSAFSVALYQPDYAGFALGDGNLVTIELNGMNISAVGPFATVAPAAVPEPSQLLLMLTGLALLGVAARRRLR